MLMSGKFENLSGHSQGIVREIKLKLRSFKISEHNNEKGDGPYHGFDYSSLVSDPLDLATWSQRELKTFCNFQQGSRYYRGFDYSSIVSDPLDLATWSQRELQTFNTCRLATFNRVVDTKTNII